MSDITARIADPEDLRVLVMLAALLIAGVFALYAVAAAPWRDHSDDGFGFRWARRR